jgi:predicted metal-dependent enzyme (double-stranded beta helix superfamily)
VDRFVADCLDAAATEDQVPALRELMERAVSKPQALRDRFPVPVDPDDDGILHRSSGLFVSSGIFPRGFETGLHDHSVPAVIGVWARHEDNLLYRRTKDGLEAEERLRVESGSVLVLDADTVHDVHAPVDGWSGALHVYLGDILAADRSSWADPAEPPIPFDGAALGRRWSTAAASTGLTAPR